MSTCLGKDLADLDAAGIDTPQPPADGEAKSRSVIVFIPAGREATLSHPYQET